MSQHRVNSGGFGKRPVLGVEEKRPASFMQKLSSAFDFTRPLKSQEIMIFTARLDAVPSVYLLYILGGVTLAILFQIPKLRALPPEDVSAHIASIFIFGPIAIVASLLLWGRQSVRAACAIFAMCAIQAIGLLLDGKLTSKMIALTMLALSAVAMRGAFSLSRARR